MRAPASPPSRCSRSGPDGRRASSADAHRGVRGQDESGTVEATVNGQLRLTDLRIDPRILGLGAPEVIERINQALGAAAEFANECVEAEVGELEDDVVAALVKLRDLPPAK